ncbi:HAMP domain-containing histidine kinase [Sphingobacterium sp. SGG-5]|uniref:sensor histidine kinase n=1 Tax=Sphingobacterium sp. SGG-5 TaxID=2710881 RepID=UPI0013ED3B9D|nr:HAMP domain-containing sensor histidine kinase [Sphingobacterium sp. SGG-5]NGM62916.1 HAMP domain-containing histidine kinase [Sphingobacterium sp. SGG-5]
MHNQELRYRKNWGLLITFSLLVTILFAVVAYLARVMTINFVETEFNNKKVEIFDESILQFTEFFTEKIPEISYYQGYIDSVQALDMANVFLRKYPFIHDITFYDIILTNKDSVGEGLKAKNLSILVKTKIRYLLNQEHKLLIDNQTTNRVKISEDFNNMMLKLISYLDKSQDSLQLTDIDFYKIFYGVQPGKVSYLNIPRTSDLIAYQALMNRPNLQLTSYNQDLFIFDIDPRKLKITNKYPDLYEHISIKPVVDQTVSDHAPYLTTELPLPGALSEFKLQFESSDYFISKNINQRFFPVISGLIAIYLILLGFVYMIYRNVMINSKLYQLQYDFINNLTHEFKTPVSVIKIAGNNIKSADKLSNDERAMYGRILDQEADKLNSLMNKLLSFAQIENKSLKFNGEYIDINEFCQHIIDASQLKYPDLKLNFMTNATQEMFADPVLLNSVFQNLVDNAYKYSPIDRKILDIKVEQTKKNFVIVFRDQGIGIDKKEFNSIFKKFYRVKNQFNQQGSIGLGLAFCKEITEFMHGEIKVESQVGKGTIFTLIFPIEVK